MPHYSYRYGKQGKGDSWSVYLCSSLTGDTKDVIRVGIPKCAAMNMVKRLNKRKESGNEDL
jgi:hypothetical protein